MADAGQEGGVVRAIKVSPDDEDIRLDRWFHRHFPELSHGRLEKLLRTGHVRVDGGRAKAALRLAAGQTVRVPPLGPSTPRPRPAVQPVSESDKKSLQDSILYKDSDVLIIDKPGGLAVQGGTGTTRHLDAMLDVLRFDAAERPRLVHRLDRDTSGVLVLARSAAAAAWLGQAFRASGTVRKTYWALTLGVARARRGRIDLPLEKRGGRMGERVVVADDGGQRAVTDYAVLDAAADKIAWLALRPLTGRTHQLRAHCAAIGKPILGDGKYGGIEARPPDGLARRLHLHARSIAFETKSGRSVQVDAALPDELAQSWGFFGFTEPPPGDPFA